MNYVDTKSIYNSSGQLISINSTHYDLNHDNEQNKQLLLLVRYLSFVIVQKEAANH